MSPNVAPTLLLVRIEPGPRTTAATIMAGPIYLSGFFMVMYTDREITGGIFNSRPLLKHLARGITNDRVHRRRLLVEADDKSAVVAGTETHF